MTQQGPAPINLDSISEQLLGTIAQALGLDLTKVQPDEFRLGIVEELDKMVVYTSAGLTSEKLARAARTAYENLMELPTFYSNPPNQEFAHVLTGKQFAGDHVQHENNLQKYIDHIVLNEDFSELLASLKAAPANAWAAAKAKLSKSTRFFKGAISAAVSKLEGAKGKLDPWVQTFRQAEQQSGEKLPVNQTMQIAMGLPALAKQAEAEVAQETADIERLPQPTPAAQESYVREITSILDEGARGFKQQAPKRKGRFLNEALTPMVVFGFVLAIVAGIPMLVKALFKLAKKLKLEKTAKALEHAHHVVHGIEEKVVDYAIPDRLSYNLYTNLWKKGFKVRGSQAFNKPMEYEAYRAGEGKARHQVEGLVYKMLLTYFFVAGGIGAIKAAGTMLGLAEAGATSVKAVEIAGAVAEVAEIAAPVVAALEGNVG